MDKPMSVRPALDLLSQWQPYAIPFVHRDVITRAEFNAYIEKWCQQSSSRFPILYLAFHGDSTSIQVGDARRSENCVSLDELEDMLFGRCARRIIHLGSCGSVDVNGNRLNRFLRNTGALAIFGYRGYIDWLESMAFELTIFAAMQMNTLTRSGVRAMKRQIERSSGAMAKRLDFRAVVAR